MPVDYHKHKKLGLCTKCHKEAEYGGLCYKHWLGNIYTGIKSRCGNKYKNSKSNAYTKVRLLFSRDEFIKWGLSHFPIGIDRPSVGRISHDRDYELNNLELQEFCRNASKKSGQREVEDGFWKCPTCKDILPRIVKYFHRNKAQADGLASECKICANIRRTVLIKRG